MVNVSSVRCSHWNIEGVCTLSSRISLSSLTAGEPLSSPFEYVRGGKHTKGFVLEGSSGLTKSTPSSSLFSAVGAAEFLVLLLVGGSANVCASLNYLMVGFALILWLLVQALGGSLYQDSPSPSRTLKSGGCHMLTSLSTHTVHHSSGSGYFRWEPFWL
ncbi:hypothetical protein TSMEX_009176 [Taenia solium]|eukprot:TsM_000364900 transcript=TsM_000364900 gene=TsM_000364900